MSDFDFSAYIKDIPDYPEPGVVFKDITPLFDDKEALAQTIRAIAGHFKDAGITKVMGAEARGFLVGVPVAYALGVGFVPARKPGKLPREVISQSYALEYGTDSLEIHKDAFEPGDVVLIADDLIATGGTAVACGKLAERCGATIAGFAFILELEFLHPREIIAQDFDTEVYTLVQVH